MSYTKCKNSLKYENNDVKKINGLHDCDVAVQTSNRNIKETKLEWNNGSKMIGMDRRQENRKSCPEKIEFPKRQKQKDVYWGTS